VTAQPVESAQRTGASASSLPRVELRVDRVGVRFRFTYAFHARELRFERDSGEGFERLFAETFSCHADRHDPSELYIQLEDLWSNPRLLSSGANRRDAENLARRFLAALPGCLERAIDRLEAEGGAGSPLHSRTCEDIALVAHVAERFMGDHQLRDHPQVRIAPLHLRKLAFRATQVVMRAHVSDEFLGRYLAGEAELDTDREFGAFYAIASGDREATERTVLAVAERAFHRWLEQVCLDEENNAFETEGSPFRDRAEEVLAAFAANGEGPVSWSRELSVFLRRPNNRDCCRVLDKLETWFLRQYDVHHGAVVLNQKAQLEQGPDEPDRVLSRHSRRNYLIALTVLAAPFCLAAIRYDGVWRTVLDAWVSIEVVAVIALAIWFVGYRFLVKKDLTFFHAAVPRIAAGIIVGYLPVFLIDEVWDLAGQSASTLATVVVVLSMPTLVYIYVEVQRKLRDANLAFRRALDVFLLGLIQSAAFGLVVTSLLGPLMSTRNWGNGDWREGTGEVTLFELRSHLDPFLGELPRIMGIEPFPAFPTAILLMSVLAFFIGTFLQLLWEELPITEPM